MSIFFSSSVAAIEVHTDGSFFYRGHPELLMLLCHAYVHGHSLWEPGTVKLLLKCVLVWSRYFLLQSQMFNLRAVLHHSSCTRTICAPCCAILLLCFQLFAGGFIGWSCWAIHGPAAGSGFGLFVLIRAG
jgi:hypothetical protein